MSKELKLHHFLLENESEKRVYLDEDENLYITVKGLSLADIIIDKDVVGNLYLDIQNRANDGSAIVDELYKNISKQTYEVVKRCLVDEEDKLIFIPEVYEKLPAPTKNELIMTIIELTIPSKKKLQSMRNLIDRVEKKGQNILETETIKNLMAMRMKTK